MEETGVGDGVLQAVYVDTTTKEIVGLQPKPALLDLFNLHEPINGYTRYLGLEYANIQRRSTEP